MCRVKLNTSGGIACVAGAWKINMARKKSEEREGGRHAMVKVPPAQKAPQNGIFPFSERTGNSHWLRGSRGNKWSCWLAKKAVIKKDVNQRKYENVSKHVKGGKMFCWQELEKKLKFSVIGDSGTGEIILVFQCTLRTEEYRKKYIILLFLKRSEQSKLLCAFTYAGEWEPCGRRLNWFRGSKIELSKNIIYINNCTIETIKPSLWS